MKIEAKVEIVKDKYSYIIAYPVINKPGFWSNPFLILNKYKIVAISKLNKDPLVCDLCNEGNNDYLFSFISSKRLKNKKIDSWKKMCKNCCNLYINIMPLLNNETKELCKDFIKEISGQEGLNLRPPASKAGTLPD